MRSDIAAIRGADWAVAGLSVDLDFSQPQLRGTVRIARLELHAAELSFSDVILVCGGIDLSARQLGCLRGHFDLALPGTERQQFPGEIFYDLQTGTAHFSLRDVSLAGGQLTLRGAASESGVDLEFDSDGLQLDELVALAGTLAGTFPEPLGLTASGGADVSGTLQLRGGEISEVTLQAELTQASMSNEAGTAVSEGLHATIKLQAANAGGSWRFDTTIVADAGEAYVEPVYADLDGHALSISAQGLASAAADRFELTTFAVRQGTLIDASGTMQMLIPASEDDPVALTGVLHLEHASVEALYTSLLQVALAGTIAGDLEATGTVAGRIAFDDNELAGLDLVLEDISLDDRQARFAVYGLNGEIHWPGPGASPADVVASHLLWDSASAYSIPLDGSEIEVAIGADEVDLLRPLRVPTMGGALLVKRFHLSRYGSDDASGLLDAELEPIQLGDLTGAFGWPAFSGTLSGQLPLLHYEGQAMTVGGTLTAEAFDGSIEFANLRLEQPFGLVPRLYGDLRLRNLDLERLTSTFSFGLIQGALSGDVTGLEMMAWRPVAMDLHFYTPTDRSFRRRISQRAVENLASVGGGGAAAALSSGFLKFFEEFSYRRIGIRCVLKDGACAMSGTGPAGTNQFGQGFYIVQGSGVPRIDVVGYRHQVSWTELVRQLVNITESGVPTVN